MSVLRLHHAENRMCHKTAANCGEDTAALSMKVGFQDFQYVLDRLDHRNWNGEKYTVAQQSITLGGVQFLPPPPDRENGGKKGMLNWQHIPVRYKYHYAGYQVGFSGTDIPECPESNAMPNFHVKLASKALERGLINCNHVLKNIFSHTFDNIWSTILNRMDSYIDVQIPVTYFFNLWKRKKYKTILNANSDNYGQILTDKEGVLIRQENETITINRGGLIEICIYDKAKELNKAGNEWKRDIYERKHGRLPPILTRIEIRLYRDFLRSRGFGPTQSIDTIDDWLKGRVSIIKHVMTEQFQFIAEDGTMLPAWEWARDQHTKYATAENECRGIAILPIQLISSKTQLSGEQKLIRLISEVRTKLIKQGHGPISTPEEFITALKAAMKAIKHYSTPEFKLEFFNKGNRLWLQHQGLEATLVFKTDTPMYSNGTDCDAVFDFPPESNKWGIFQYLEWYAQHEYKPIS